MSNIERKFFAPLLGLKALEQHIERDTFIYILRILYRIVLKSNELNENKKQLYRRIQHFEKESNLPGFLSAMSLDQLLIELEDAQYFYPIRRQEVNLPTFH